MAHWGLGRYDESSSMVTGLPSNAKQRIWFSICPVNQADIFVSPSVVAGLREKCSASASELMTQLTNKKRMHEMGEERHLFVWTVVVRNLITPPPRSLSFPQIRPAGHQLFRGVCPVSPSGANDRRRQGAEGTSYASSMSLYALRLDSS